MGTRTEAITLFQFSNTPGHRFWLAVRVALSLGIPLALCTAFGNQPLGLQAAPGAFLSLFATTRTAGERAKVLPILGALLFACGSLGVLAAPSAWAITVGIIVVTTLAGTFMFAFKVGPPGAMFCVLIFGMAANLTAPIDGVRHAEPGIFLLAILGGILTAYLIALTPLLRASERARPRKPLRELLPGPSIGPSECRLITRVAIVATVGALLSMLWLDPHRAYWTVAAGVAVVGTIPGRALAFRRALHRTVGTALGLALFVLLVPLVVSPWVLVVMLVLLQFTVELVVKRNYALGLVFVTPLVLLIIMSAIGPTNQMEAALERLFDTAAGAFIGFLTGFLHTADVESRPAAVTAPNPQPRRDPNA